MTKGRLEAFSDGVIAIIITIMVLELPHPHSSEFAALWPIRDKFLSYALSFVYVGIYWNNHHHMLHAAKHVNGGILWANMLLLFWLSLIPFTTAWMGSSGFEPAPVATYGLVLLLAACSYYALSRLLVARHGSGSKLDQALGADFKGKISVLLYVAAIVVAFPWPLLACALYAITAIMWLVPDRRFERILAE